MAVEYERKLEELEVLPLGEDRHAPEEVELLVRRRELLPVLDHRAEVRRLDRKRLERSTEIKRGRESNQRPPRTCARAAAASGRVWWRIVVVVIVVPSLSGWFVMRETPKEAVRPHPQPHSRAATLNRSPFESTCE